jgi:zinc transport system substrate-binding protein
MKFAVLAASLMLALPGITFASNKPLRVVADIAPTHSLVSLVMGDLGKPDLLMRSGSSPHDYSLRPSDASRLAEADLVFFTSASLTPWLTRALAAVATNTPAIELLDSKGSNSLELRTNNLFQSHAHEDIDHDHTKDAADKHANRVDPHAWLDPINAQRWLEAIAAELSVMDPANSGTYHQNASTGHQALQELIGTIKARLKTVTGKPYVVFHDSYQYFETRFETYAQASISLGDGAPPSISQINHVRDRLAEFSGACVFSEPQFSDRLINTVTLGIDVKLGQLDPLGVNMEPGPSLYRELMDKLTNELVGCLQRAE